MFHVMQLTFMYQTVTDLPAALAFYRDELGLIEAWREGETTVAFELPGSPVQLMVEVPQDDHPRWKSGMFCQVPDVKAFVQEHPGIRWVGDTFEIPDGRAATFTDPAGNTVHIFDVSTDGS